MGTNVINFSYELLIDKLRLAGDPVDSRYGPTNELLGAVVEFDAGIIPSRRGLNVALGMMELMQILGGVYDLDAIKRVAPRADHQLFTPKMAYGPRIAAQMPCVIDALREDPLTRQAILFIGRPEDGPTPDQPCTTTFQFILRERVLYGFCSMRSWDAVKGLTYDVMFQGGLLMAVARCLGVEAGPVTTHAGSLHLYHSDFDKVPDGRRRRFEYASWFPAEWTTITSFCRGQVETMEKGPDGVHILER